jgi:hypothetical protein
MNEKCILSSKAQAVGEAKERVSDNGDRRTGPKGKGRKKSTSTKAKKSTSTKATVARKEASVAKPMRNAAEETEVSPTKGMPSKMSAEEPSAKAMSPKTPSEVSPVQAMTSKVAAEVPSSMATPMPAESLDVSC